MRKIIRPETYALDAQPIWQRLGHASKEAMLRDGPPIRNSNRHGDAIVCERMPDGSTYAHTEITIAKEVPDGYFIEVWARETRVHAGTSAGYHTWHGKAAVWRDWADAVVWCREHAKGRAA